MASADSGGTGETSWEVPVGAQPLRKLAEAPLKRGDGVHLEFVLDIPAGEKYVVLPFMEAAGLEHKYVLTCYTDVEAVFEKLVPKNLAMDCVQCGNPTALHRVLTKLELIERKYQELLSKERTLIDRGLIAGGGSGARAGQTAAQAAFGRADANHDGRIDFDEFASWFSKTCDAIQTFRARQEANDNQI